MLIIFKTCFISIFVIPFNTEIVLKSVNDLHCPPEMCYVIEAGIVKASASQDKPHHLQSIPKDAPEQ